MFIFGMNDLIHFDYWYFQLPIYLRMSIVSDIFYMNDFLFSVVDMKRHTPD